MFAVAVAGQNLFAGTNNGGVYLSTNNGTSWILVETGLPNLHVRSLATHGTNLFAGLQTGGVWRRPLSEITSVEAVSTQLPIQFSLSQNFPNPFNPTTTIEFAIPHSGLVTIEVFDGLGQVVARLIHEDLPPGKYRTTWDASASSSGVYFYRLQAGSYSHVKKCVLLK